VYCCLCWVLNLSVHQELGFLLSDFHHLCSENFLFSFWLLCALKRGCYLFSILQFLVPLFKSGFECTTMGIDLWVWFFLCVFLPIERRYRRLRRLRKTFKISVLWDFRYSPHILTLQNLEWSIVWRVSLVLKAS
jgi:hypothetical protein